MKTIRFTLMFALAVVALASATPAQPSAQPKQDTLLNGLKVLLWYDAARPDVEVRVRIHSGSAFDPQGKEGVMKLLAENVFPNETAREFFKEDLGGGLEIRTTYDYIEIRASGRADAYLQILETLAAAVASPAIDKETTARLRVSLLESLKRYESDPAYVADRAIAQRLFGTFPYGRPVFGTTSSVSKIEFADLIDARQRFLTADNATISIAGNFDRKIAPKAVKRYFGAWLKSDRRVPSTFKQADPPAAGLLSVASPQTEVSGLRFAVRGVARKDKDIAAAKIFTMVLASRLKALVPADHANEVFVRSEERTLPGIFVIGFDAKRSVETTPKLEAADIIAAALAASVTDAEFAAARAAFADQWRRKDAASFWLDADTYGITSVDADMKAADNATIADVNAFADKLRKSPMASVLVNSAPATAQ